MLTAAVDQAQFEATLMQERLPDVLPDALRVLWLDAKGDWHGAHEVAQEIGDRLGSRLHAYLHRKEGDLPNASYWYRRAGATMPQTALQDEWRALVAAAVAQVATE